MILKETRVYYIAGPMTGYPKFNFPRFKQVADELRARRIETINPADLEFENVKLHSLQSETGELDENGLVAGHSWGDFLSRDVKIVADEADGVVAIDKWYESKGARLEVFTALQQHKPVFHYTDGKERLLTTDEALAAICMAMTGMRTDQQ